MKSPYKIILKRHITEKASMLEQLHTAESNPCVAKCDTPKYVFIVDDRANKQEIAKAIEEIYKEKDVKVRAVNTVRIKPKAKNRSRRRGRPGATSLCKKAIVTLEAGDLIDQV